MPKIEKLSFEARVQALELRESDKFIELIAPDLRATFYRTHFDSLRQHIFDVEKDFKTHLAGGKIERRIQGQQVLKLFDKTMLRIRAASERDKASYVRWLAIGVLTWIKSYLEPHEPVETVLDNFFTLSDEELNAETTQRARQMILWQAWCVKEFAARKPVEPATAAVAAG